MKLLMSRQEIHSIPDIFPFLEEFRCMSVVSMSTILLFSVQKQLES
uniref:Uncharacterized protein n=1 Tax=Arundo donax TaxID=35708 RepID=A0A0A9FJ39_ARUDO